VVATRTTRTSHVLRAYSRKPARAAPIDDTDAEPNVVHEEEPKYLAWTRTDAPRSEGRATTDAYTSAPERVEVGSDDHDTVLTQVTVRSVVTTLLPGTLEATTARSRPLTVFVKAIKARPVEPVRPAPTVSQVLVPAALRCSNTDTPEAATVEDIRFLRSRTVMVATGLVPYADEVTALTEAVRRA